jgi:hypothetical protein
MNTSGKDVMKKIEIGDRVKVKGDTQHYILVDPGETHAGEVIGREAGQLLVKLDTPIIRGTVEFRQVSVPETKASLSKD